MNAAAPRVALTFDAEHPDRPRCPPDACDRILDALAEANVRATFFVQGRWAEAYPERARRLADDGHLVGHHSMFHARMPLLHDDGIRQDVREGEDRIRAACGVDPRPWFRCPFGDGHDDLRITDLLRELGYRDVFWTAEVEDWEPWRSGPQIRDDVLDHVGANGDGSVVLLHTWPGPTADAVPGILEGLASEGAALVTIDRLEHLP